MTYCIRLKNPTLFIIFNEAMLSMDALTQVMTYMSEYQYIDIIANDTNASIGEYVSHLLWSVGKVVHIYYNGDKQLYVGLNILKEHVVIFISKVGNNGHFMKIAKTLKERGFKTILLTFDLNVSLTKYCDYCLYGLVEKTSAKLRDSVFYTSLKYILDLIYVILFSQNYKNTIQLEQIYKDIYENEP